MGASSWHYFTPHRPDPEAALQELRQDVFVRRDYSMGGGGFARADGTRVGMLGGFALDPAQLAAMGCQFNDELLRVLQAAQSGDYGGLKPEERFYAEQIHAFFPNPGARPSQGTFNTDDADAAGEVPGYEPGSIEELLEMVAEDGTHSILDIEHIGECGEFGVAAPLDSSRITQYFGTEQPTREQVEQNWGAVAEQLGRWEAFYVTLYRDGQPHEYAFIGCSGD